MLKNKYSFFSALAFQKYAETHQSPKQIHVLYFKIWSLHPVEEVVLEFTPKFEFSISESATRITCKSYKCYILLLIYFFFRWNFPM